MFGKSIVGTGQHWIVWLHGFMGSGSEFRPFAETLSARYASLLLDLPGHGRSVWPPDRTVSFDALSEALDDLLEQEGISNYSLVGYSMGGRLALYHAFHSRRKCRAVVVESAHPGLTSPRDRRRRASRDEAIAGKLQRVPFDEFVRDWYRGNVFRGLRRDPRVVRQIADRRLDNDPQRLAAVLRQLGTGRQKPLWPNLRTTRVPIRWVVGRRDGKYVAVARRAAALSRRIDAVVVPDAGHVVHIESARAYLCAIESFLSIHEVQGRYD